MRGSGGLPRRSAHGFAAYDRDVLRSAGRWRWRALVVGLAMVAVLVGAGVGVVRRLGAPLPVTAVRPALPVIEIAPGRLPALSWPREGQAAVTAEGIGTLGVHGTGRPIPIGSVAKVMTALVILHDHPLTGRQSGPLLSVGRADEHAYTAAIGTGDSLLQVRAGERITERQALEALMLPSADNVADLLAAWDAHSAPAFVAKMNRTARQLGATHTHYADASGLSPRTTSTATDQVRIGERALTVPVLRSIVGERTARLPVTGVVKNYNVLLGRDGVIGIKTGSTRAAGGNLLFAASSVIRGRPVTLVGAVLGQSVGLAPLDALARALATSRTLVRQAFGALQLNRTAIAGTRAGWAVTPWGEPVELAVAADHTGLVVPEQATSVREHACVIVKPAAARAPCGSITLTQGDALSGHTTVEVGLVRSAVVGPSLFWRLTHLP